MHKQLFTLTFSFCFLLVSAQRKQAVELTLLGRFDKHADYITNFDGRSFNDTIQLYGLSYGSSLKYRRFFAKGFSISLGAGYYRLSINRINTTQHPFRGVGHSRPIEYIDRSSNIQPSWLYSTPSYHYNNLCLSFDFEKSFPLRKDLSFDVSAGFSKYYTFSQGYKITAKHEMFPNWTKNWQGMGVNIGLGFCKNMNNVYFKPELILPVYQQIRGDQVLGERPQMRIEKWFSGMGLSIKVGKFLN
jgi:hypothetical protein